MPDPRRRVAVFGGSFNPPHVGHQMVALWVLETQAVDEVWLVPCFKHPFDKEILPFEHRLAMCERAALGLGTRARVDDVERRLGGDSRTLRTIASLREAHPDADFSLVVGADLLGEVASWWGSEELQRTVPFIVAGRQGADARPTPEPQLPAVSSTRIRADLGAGRDVSRVMPRAILDYIYAHGLYDAVLTRMP